MRNRKIQRELKRMGVDELLGPKNYVGISDPTPAQAIKNIRKQVIADAKDEMIRLEELNAARAEVEKTTNEKPVTQKMFRAI